MKFLVDECVGKRFYRLLINEGFQAEFIGKWKKGASDEEVIVKSIRTRAVIVTEDKDFGELIFRRKLKPYGIIIFRTRTTDPHRRIFLLKKVFSRINLENKLIVISDNVIKIKKIRNSRTRNPELLLRLTKMRVPEETIEKAHRSLETELEEKSSLGLTS